MLPFRGGDIMSRELGDKIREEAYRQDTEDNATEIIVGQEIIQIAGDIIFWLFKSKKKTAYVEIKRRPSVSIRGGLSTGTALLFGNGVEGVVAVEPGSEIWREWIGVVNSVLQNSQCFV